MDLWHYLQHTTKPILLYGMGNGADKIIAVCEEKEIEIADIFASDDFVRGQQFHGKTVIKYSDAVNKYGNFIVLVAFGTCIHNVIRNIRKIAKEQELYAPDVPVAGNTLFCDSFYSEHKADLDKVRSLLEDDKSKKVFDELIAYKLDGKINHFKIDTDQLDDLYDLGFGDYNSYVDLGAFVGDTIDELVPLYPSIHHVVAFEPSERVFRKLKANVEKYTLVTFDLWNMASSDEERILLFSDGAGRNSKVSETNSLDPHQGKIKEMKCNSVDNVYKVQDQKILIKIDVEGEEKATLNGCRNLIQNNSCDLIVSAYHRSEDLFEIPLQLKEISPDCKLYLRKHKYIPAWDINLYVKG